MVNYDKYAETFSNSRKNLKWEEIDYFLNDLKFGKNTKILDVGAGNGRLFGELKNLGFGENYLGIEKSKNLIIEAEKHFPEAKIKNLDMLFVDELGEKFDFIFFIASFHHLENFSDRISVLEKMKKILLPGAKIYFTNWALNSQILIEKYGKYKIKNSQNEFLGEDYLIPIGDFERFYHCFSLLELQNLFEKTGFKILENRLFDNQKNFVSIITL